MHWNYSTFACDLVDNILVLYGQVLIRAAYHLTPEKQKMNLILLTLTVALRTEWVCLCCWIEFLAGVLVSAHPYCPDVVAARRHQAVS